MNLGTVFGAETKTKRFVTRYIKVTHCDLFFADAAVLVEGPAERILVPFFVRHHAELSSLHECYITWLEIGGSHAHRLKSLINHLGLTSLIITDLDARNAENKSVLPIRGAGQQTRNPTLKYWCPGKKDLDELLDLKPREKSIWHDRQRFAVRAAYQCPIEIEFKGRKEEALCNTLEDALVLENHTLFCESDGTGLCAKFKTAIENSSDVAGLVQSVLNALDSGGKAEFALNLLELDNPQKLQPPFYILDGLKWLSAQLEDRQEDLGLTVTKAVPDAEEQVDS